MNIYDACKALNISGAFDPDSVKLAYRKASAIYHPDRNPAGTVMMQLINEAYDYLKDKSTSGNEEEWKNGKDYNQECANYGADLNDALNAIIHLTGLEIELCGSWLWVGGDTKPHKDVIKAAGFKWAGKKSKWYFKPEGTSARRGKKQFAMDEIRTMHGSKPINTRSYTAITA